MSRDAEDAGERLSKKTDGKQELGGEEQEAATWQDGAPMGHEKAAGKGHSLGECDENEAYAVWGGGGSTQ